MKTTGISPSRKIRQLTSGLVYGCLLIACALNGLAYTKSGTNYTTDGSQSDVQAAINNASAGDTVNIPSGAFTWGANASSLKIGTAITLQGQGTNSTFINLAASGPTYGNGTINIYTSAIVKDFTINCVGSPATSFSATGTGWRITNIKYNGTGATSGYFCYTEGAMGLIDNCNLIGYGGTDEMIFMRGPVNSWQTPDSMGTANAVYIENCIFGGSGYVCDANANARAVIRFCTITGEIKIDGHGKASNSPARGVRQLEIYNNLWTASSYFTAIEIRGGTGMCFNNTNAAPTGDRDWLFLTDYGYTAQWPNFGNVYQTPANYPIDDQIGVGQDPKTAGSSPYYLWGNSASGADWFLQWKDIPAGAIYQYTNETGSTSSTFTMQGVIAADRDYFKGTLGVTFTGSGGVGIGTKAQMLAITPTKTLVGFWVTDEGGWNTILPANTSGQLYTWNGSVWTLKYTPYTYPFTHSAQNLKLAPPNGLQAAPAN
jgi:hypothetical protein